MRIVGQRVCNVNKQLSLKKSKLQNETLQKVTIM
jgi:hypothetical protein